LIKRSLNIATTIKYYKIKEWGVKRKSKIYECSGVPKQELDAETDGWDNDKMDSVDGL
jgi:hypothetical protein